MFVSEERRGRKRRRGLVEDEAVAHSACVTGLSRKAPRWAHDATCSNVMRTEGVDAPFLSFYLFSFTL